MVRTRRIPKMIAGGFDAIVVCLQCQKNKNKCGFWNGSEEAKKRDRRCY
jgi:hypothetical protein